MGIDMGSSEINYEETAEVTVEVETGEIEGVVQKELSNSSPNVFRTQRKQI